MRATGTDELQFTPLIDLQWWQNRRGERAGLDTRLREAGRPVFVRTNWPDAPAVRRFVNGIKHLWATYTR